MRLAVRITAAALLAAVSPAAAETAARDLFGAVPAATTSMAPAAIGGYAKGCLAGGQMLPPEGPHWQAVRLSRNRNWGHPAMVRFLTGFAAKARTVTGWPGLLIGDIAQPRGGPMRNGHASHQLGIDADIWLTPMPARTLSRQEREDLEPVNLVAESWTDIDPAKWTPAHLALIHLAASQPEVERVFVNPAIKKELCRSAGADRAWLARVRPIYGHNYHMHIRLACPPGEDACERQAPPPGGDGCGQELAWWFTPEVLHPKPGKPRPPLTMAQLPAACATVLKAP